MWTRDTAHFLHFFLVHKKNVVLILVTTHLPTRIMSWITKLGILNKLDKYVKMEQTSIKKTVEAAFRSGKTSEIEKLSQDDLLQYKQGGYLECKTVVEERLKYNSSSEGKEREMIKHKRLLLAEKKAMQEALKREIEANPNEYQEEGSGSVDEIVEI